MQPSQPTQPNFDNYLRNFRIFYSQVIKGHSQEEEHARGFKALIQAQVRNGRRLRAGGRISQEQPISNPQFATKFKEQQKNKKTKVQIEILNSTLKLHNAIVFAYLLYLLQHKNADAFEELQQGMSVALKDQKVFPIAVHRRITFAWRKLDDIMTGRRRMVRVDKVMQDYFREFNQSFLDLVWSILVPSQQDRCLADASKLFPRLADILCIKINYFELAQNHNITFTTYGKNFQYGIKLGVYSKDNMYLNVFKMPQKQQKQVNKQITLSQFKNISHQLYTMYQDDMKQLMALPGLLNNRIGNRERSQSQISNKSRVTGFASRISRVATIDSHAISMDQI